MFIACDCAIPKLRVERIPRRRDSLHSPVHSSSRRASINIPLLTERTHSTVTRARTARKRFSLIPRTIIRCSARRNGPYFSRCSTMRSARPLPIPGSVSSSFAEAALTLIFGAAREADELCSGGGAALGAVACERLAHEVAESETNRRSVSGTNLHIRSYASQGF